MFFSITNHHCKNSTTIYSLVARSSWGCYHLPKWAWLKTEYPTFANLWFVYNVPSYSAISGGILTIFNTLHWILNDIDVCIPMKFHQFWSFSHFSPSYPSVIKRGNVKPFVDGLLIKASIYIYNYTIYIYLYLYLNIYIYIMLNRRFPTYPPLMTPDNHPPGPRLFNIGRMTWKGT